MISNFKAINCRACGKLIWTGYTSAGCPAKLDTARLSILEEIVKKINNIRTYEAHRTLVSFEATSRIGARVIGTQPNPEAVILAEHSCESFTLFETEVPDYWNRNLVAAAKSEGIPF